MIRLTAKLVAAYVRNNSTTAAELKDLIQTTYNALANAQAPAAPVVELTPAVSVRKSVTPEAIICLECGAPQKMLKRHLDAAHGLSVDEYKAKWSLPSDYPVVAPNYATLRSELAVKIGLGRKRGDSENGKQPHRYPTSRWAKPGE